MLLEEMVNELCSDVRVSETVALASGGEMGFILLICMCKMPWKRRKAETLAVTSASVWSAAGVTNGLVCVCVAWCSCLCVAARGGTAPGRREPGAGPEPGSVCRALFPCRGGSGAFSALLGVGEVGEPCLAGPSWPSTWKSQSQQWLQGKWKAS